MPLQSHNHADTSIDDLPGADVPGSRQPPNAGDWVAVRSIVEQLYVVEDLPLREVKRQLQQDHGFKASERMFKDRLKKWGLVKNLTREDWIALAVLNARRKASGKRSTRFSVRGRRKTVRDLQKYSRSQGLTEDSLAALALGDLDIPGDLRAVTPEPEQDAAVVEHSPSERSYKNSPSPKRTLARDTTRVAAATFPSGPLGCTTVRTLSTGSASLASQRSFSFALVGSHDHTSQSGYNIRSGTLSQTSAGSENTALTNSTMATSISSGYATENDNARGNSHNDTYQRGLVFNVEDRLAASRTSSDGFPSPSSCDHVSRDFELMGHQLVEPAPLRSRCDAEDITSWMLLEPLAVGADSMQISYLCPVCNQPSRAHFISIHNTAPQEPARNILNDDIDATWEVPTSTKDEGAWKWIALCFIACINLSKSNLELSDHSLNEASSEFEKLITRRDRMILTAANQMITILHMHSQGATATRIMKSAQSVTDRLLQHDDPIRVTIDFLTAYAEPSGTSLKDCGITSDTLHSIYSQLSTDPNAGPQHPYTIAAFYNWSWLLRREGHYLQAEHNFQQVYTVSCSIFGRYHMQSIGALSTLAGVYIHLGKTQEAIATYQAVINDCKQTVGKSHPYRLEAKRRLAGEYGKLGQKEPMVALYWQVLVGRVLMLGRGHKFTRGQRRDYEKLLRELDQWDERRQEEVEELFADKERNEQIPLGRERSGSHSSTQSEYQAF